MTKVTTILIFEKKNSSKFKFLLTMIEEVKKVLIKKRHMNGEKHIVSMDFGEYLRKAFQRTAKFMLADYYEIDFMKGILI